MKELSKTILDIERDIRDTLENDYKEKSTENKKIEFEDVIYIGEVTWNDRINGKPLSSKLFAVRKEITTRNKKGEEQKREMYEYYLDKKYVGAGINIRMPQLEERFKISEPEKAKQIERLLENIQDKDLLENSLKYLERQELENIAEALGIEAKDIKEISEVDLKQKILSIDENKLSDKDKKDQKEEEENKDDEEIKLDENETKHLNIREETKLNQYIKGQTLDQKLGLEKIGITDGVKLARVSTSSLESKKRSFKIKHRHVCSHKKKWRSSGTW